MALNVLGCGFFFKSVRTNYILKFLIYIYIYIYLFHFSMWVLIGCFLFFFYVGGLNRHSVWQRCLIALNVFLMVVCGN